jgi:hypothetical protein
MALLTVGYGYIGKEANRLDDRITGLIGNPDEYRTVYEDPNRTTWSELVLPVLRIMDGAVVARAVGVHPRTLERWLYKGVRPHRAHEQALTELAAEYAANGLRRSRIK